MRILLTGMNGTVAPALAAHLKGEGHQTISWNRKVHPIESQSQIKQAIDQIRPDVIFHIATGPLEWLRWIAEESARRSIPLLHTSSVSVYGAHQSGPLTPDIQPEPDDDYGRYKFEGEQIIAAINPEAHIFRIGWQIGDGPGSNNMVDYFHRQVTEHGILRASTKWFPACSHLSATASCLCRQMLTGAPGVYHVDANPGFSIFEIAQRTAVRLHADWKVESVEDPRRDNRMQDPRIQIQSI